MKTADRAPPGMGDKRFYVLSAHFDTAGRGKEHNGSACPAPWLLTYSPHRGYHVTRMDVEELQQIQDIREILEGGALREAVGNISAQTIAAMTARRRVRPWPG